MLILLPSFAKFRSVSLRGCRVSHHHAQGANQSASVCKFNRVDSRHVVACLARLRSDWRRPRQLVSFECSQLCPEPRYICRWFPRHLGSGKHRSRAAQREAMGWRWRRTPAVLAPPTSSGFRGLNRGTSTQTRCPLTFSSSGIPRTRTGGLGIRDRLGHRYAADCRSHPPRLCRLRSGLDRNDLWFGCSSGWC